MNTFKEAFLLSVLAIFIFFLQEKSGIAEAKALTRGKVRIARNVVSSITKNGIKHIKHAKRKVVSSSAKKKHGIPGERRSFSSKHFIERSLQPNNPFGHLSDLLGIKGSFIPSQTNQNWLGDDEQSASDNDMETNSEKKPENHNVNNEISSIGGTLPLDISPQQANMIASSAPTNQQRQKFLKWEHQSGSLDMQHFPSKYLQDEKQSDADDGEVNEAVERAPFHSRKPASVGADDVNGPAFSRMKADTNSPRFESVRPKKIFHALESSNNRNAAKKGYMDYMNDQFDTPAYPHSGHQLHQVNGYAGNRMSSSRVQPLTHEMINNLQMDPAWDAMEAKILAQHGHRGAPLRLAESKIDKEIMPPEGEPVGQPYLPEPQQRLHNTMISNFQRPAEFPPQDIQPELKPASFYSHYQAQNGPHNIHMGGVLGKSSFHHHRKLMYDSDVIPQHIETKQRNYFPNVIDRPFHHHRKPMYDSDFIPQHIETKQRNYFSNGNVVRPLKSSSKIFHLRFTPHELPFMKKVDLSSQIDKLSTANVFDVNANELN